jgi:hypothetical protein
MLRVPVLSVTGDPLMPAKASRVRRWLKSGKAKVVYNDLKIFAVQLVEETGCEVQPCILGIDPGKHFTGMAVQSAKFTLWLAHIQLPFKTVTERMSQRRMMRRNRRGRRINRKRPYLQRNHRAKRFDNRRASKLPPSIRANRELELRVKGELIKIFPIEAVVYEIVKARGDKGFSPVMVGQNWMLEALTKGCEDSILTSQEGWLTASLRQQLRLSKNKDDKSLCVPETHAVDGVALAASYFVRYRQLKNRQGWWEGEIRVTSAPFTVIRRPPICRRQLHLMVKAKGGIRRKYGGTVTRHELSKGDYVRAEQAGRVYYGWVSGDTERQVSVSDVNWKRLGQFCAKKVQLLQRSTGLIVVPSARLSNLAVRRGEI